MMFIIPLGLQTKLRSVPWASIFLLVITCLVSVRDFEKHHLAARGLYELIQSTGIQRASENLHKQYCETSANKNCGYELAMKLTREPSSLKTLPAYQEYQKANTTFEKERTKQIIQDGGLVRGNHNLKSSLYALFTHAGWLHLIGNMLTFFAFAVFLEQRVGLFWFVLIYLVGGFVSNIMQLPFLPKGTQLIGASGAISAVVGAFAGFYWNEKMSVIVSYFFLLNKKVLMPCWIYILIFFVINDLVGVVDSSSAVAHVAHLGGFAFGTLAALLHQEFSVPANKRVPS